MSNHKGSQIGAHVLSIVLCLRIATVNKIVFKTIFNFRDCVTGNCVRLMTGHKSSVTTVVFSYDGRFLATGECDYHVLVWDIAHGHLLGDFAHHSAMVTSLCFSRCRYVM